MGAITGKINLAMLKHVVIEKKGKTGMVKGVFIPIEANNLFLSEKTGAIYMDTISFDLKEVKDDQTHLTKQSLPKEARDKMTKEEQNEQPIIGSLNTNFGGVKGGASNNVAHGITLGDDDEVPF